MMSVSSVLLRLAVELLTDNVCKEFACVIMVRILFQALSCKFFCMPVIITYLCLQSLDIGKGIKYIAIRFGNNFLGNIELIDAVFE